jgi:beta-glucanase (GH16 family)
MKSVVLGLGVFMVACTQPPVDAPLPDPPVVDGWTLTWNDEFDGNAGTAPDASKWNHDVGGGGWGNDQLEFNTDSLDNAALDGDGHLVITTIKQQFGANDYTSARLQTRGKLDQQYGRFEARIKLPTGPGMWPAFWLLGSSIDSVGWPECGELDIMEARGSEPATNHGSAHGPGYSGNNPHSAPYTLDDGSFHDDFHVFSIEWSPGEAHWFVDGDHYHAVTLDTMPDGQRWVFDGSMFIILDAAVGGWFGGDVDDGIFPQQMVVDYVRAYQAEEAGGS